MALACSTTRKRVYAKASFDVCDRTGQSVRSHSAPLDRSRIVRFRPVLATIRLLERMFYKLAQASGGCQYGHVSAKCGRDRARPPVMSGAAPGRCADCGSDAYIQLSVENAMLCAHCYADRLGLSRIAAGKGGERVVNPPALRPRPS